MYSTAPSLQPISLFYFFACAWRCRHVDAFALAHLAILYRSIRLSSNLFAVFSHTVRWDEILRNITRRFYRILRKYRHEPSNNLPPFPDMAISANYLFHDIFCLQVCFAGFLSGGWSFGGRGVAPTVCNEFFCQMDPSLGTRRMLFRTRVLLFRVWTPC